MAQGSLIGRDSSSVRHIKLGAIRVAGRRTARAGRATDPQGTLVSGARVCLLEGMSISWGCQSHWEVALVTQGGSSIPFSVSSDTDCATWGLPSILWGLFL